MTITIKELIPRKLFEQCLVKEAEGWEMVDLESSHRSGFTVRVATLYKYENKLEEDIQSEQN